MPVVRKVQSKVTLSARWVGKPSVEKEVALEGSEARGRSFNQEGIRTKKACFFCKGRMEPHYFDSASLRKFVSDRGKILPRGRSGACAKHQRRVSREIKRARLLALLPFTPSI